MVAVHINRAGALSFTGLMRNMFYWWPIVPVALYALWRCRKEPWFPVVGLWGLTLTAGMGAGIMGLPFVVPRYLAPVELGVFFPVSVCLLARLRVAPGPA
jgi:hypothetical protein